MALQIRRGTDAERLTITPAEGELIYTTDTKLLYVGDGSTAGGTKADTGINDLLEDTTPQLGGSLDVNGQSIISASNGNIVVAPNGSGELQLDSNAVRLLNNPSTPSSESGYNKLYAKTPSSGGTGLFFTNTTASDELVSKSKAIVYGIIF